MALFSLFTGGGSGSGHAYPTDTISAADGTVVTFSFFKQASLAIEVAG